MHNRLLHFFAIVVLISSGSVFGQSSGIATKLLEANETEFAELFPKLKEQADQALTMLTEMVEQKLPADADQENKEKFAKKQTNAAVALLLLRPSDRVWPLLQHSPDPRVRSYLIYRMALSGVDPQTLIKRLEIEQDISIRRALILSLGEFETTALSLDARQTLLPKLQEIYREEADPGLHAASEWLLREWQQQNWLIQINEEWMNARSQQKHRYGRLEKSLADKNASLQWMVTCQGQTMVVIAGPVEFMMGSPEKEADRDPDETQHKRRIGRTFALSNKTVTVEQYRRFEPEYSPPKQQVNLPDMPATDTSWYDAAEYCNWLSKEEGIPEDQWCFKITDSDITWKHNYLSLTGYRMPTQAEMEYATRAGAVTARYYGETKELLPMYAWYEKNSQDRAWPVGRLKPNDFGLFDTLGNVNQWCQESGREYPEGNHREVSEDQEDDLSGQWSERRAFRGGAYNWDASTLRSAYRNSEMPLDRSFVIGFRLARTISICK